MQPAPPTTNYRQSRLQLLPVVVFVVVVDGAANLQPVAATDRKIASVVHPTYLPLYLPRKLLPIRGRLIEYQLRLG